MNIDIIGRPQAEVTAQEIIQRYQAGDRDFTKLNLTGIDFGQADLREAIFNFCDMSYANLKGATLSSCNFLHTNLSFSKMCGVQLNNANLVHAHLSDADLSKADLRWANLSCADLSYADLSGAKLTDAELAKATLFAATLEGTYPAFESHEFWAELLAQRAETQEQRELACLIGYGYRFSWCWDDFVTREINPELRNWALTAIKSYSLNLKNCPHKASILKH